MNPSTLSRRARPHFEVLLAAVVLAAHLYAALAPATSLMNWFLSDDAFYYFKTAQNISEGYGITFDRLGHEGGFHPLWMAVCVPLFALARFDLLMPLRLVVMTSALLNIGTGVLVYRLAGRAVSRGAAAVAALFFCLYPPIHAAVFQLGLESGLSALCLALLLLAAARAEGEAGLGRLALVGGAAALALMARLDNVFVIGMVGAWLALGPVAGPGGRGRALALVDVCWIALGVLAAFFLRVGFGPDFAGYSRSEYALLGLALAARMGAYALAGLYGPALEAGGRAWPARALAAWAGSTAVVAAGMLGLLAVGVLPGFPRLALAYEAAAALAGLLLTRGIWVVVGGTAPRTPALQESEILAVARRAVVLFAPAALTLLAYMTFYQLYFGTPSPVSGQIKRWWGTLPNPVYGHPAADLGGLLGFGVEGGPWELSVGLLLGPFAGLEGPTARALTVLWALGLVAALLLIGYAQRDRVKAALARLPLLPLAAGSFLHALSYFGTGYLHVREWYWTAQMLLLALIVGVVFDALLAATGRARPARLVPALVGTALALALAVQIYTNLPYPSGAMAGSLADTRAAYGVTELEQRTEPGARIGSTGGGVIAYLIRERTIVNLDGLMNTAGYFHALQTGTAADYLSAVGLDYVFAGEYVITSSDPYFQFAGHLEKIAAFGGGALFRWK